MKTVTLLSIEKKYGKRIKTSFKNEIERYLSNPIAQMYITKALEYKLSENDYKQLYLIGGFNSKQFPKLNWLCTVYIHPLTIAEYTLRGCEKLTKKLS